ncbi:hypothetical protein WJX74_004859 [Apatococcus lobatus]|uniref:Mannosyltransferase n=1 Tax=Apatococcus lobatus TaxID=904363 RepID=A0AAW1SGN3_9CHLO
MFELRKRLTGLSTAPQPAQGRRQGLSRKPQQRWSASIKVAFLVIFSARLLSAFLNIVHDCDEVFNYWEPLHYLFYGYGLQTWEYSSQYALRSYWYLLLHTGTLAPATVLLGDAEGKRMAFFLTRAGLGFISAVVETALFRQTRLYAGDKVARYLLLFLTASSGMFVASTALLPSTFAMYSMTAAAAAVLARSPLAAEASAAIGIIWAWPVAAIAFLPYAIYVLLSTHLFTSVAAALGLLVFTLAPLVAADRIFYGQWTVSLWNFLKYNVVGGGDSALYGVEPASYYVKNGALNLNVALALFCLYPLAVLLQLTRHSGTNVLLALAVCPAYVWFAAISALPHKEERFLYVVYPLVCLAAAAVLSSLPSVIQQTATTIFPKPFHKTAGLVARLTPRCCAAVFVLLSVSRLAALLLGYGAPMHIYSKLPSRVPAHLAEANQTVPVCVAAEWYRFPSSFFLPSPIYRLQFVKSGFQGLLPRPFEATVDGTAGSSPYFNDRNSEVAENSWDSIDECAFLVKLQNESPPHYDTKDWRLLASRRFLEAEQSPPLTRALYIPFLSARSNVYTGYQLFVQTSWQQAVGLMSLPQHSQGQAEEPSDI